MISLWLLPGISCWTIWQKSKLGCSVSGVTGGETNMDITEINQARHVDLKIQLSKCEYEIEPLTLMMVSKGPVTSNSKFSKPGLEDKLPQVMARGVPGQNMFKESQGSAENVVPRNAETDRCSDFIVIKL